MVPETSEQCPYLSAIQNRPLLEAERTEAQTNVSRSEEEDRSRTKGTLSEIQSREEIISGPAIVARYWKR
jgi:hypothetical protein